MPASRSVHRPSLRFTVEALLVVAALSVISGIAPVSALVPILGPDPGATETPAVDPCASLDPSVAADPQASVDPAASPDASASPAADPGLRVDHFWVDTIDWQTGVSVPGPIDSPAVGMERGRLYVVRFQVVNDSARAIELVPVLEFDGAAVPAVDPVPGVPFYTSANVRRGESPGSTAIPVAGLRLATVLEPVEPVEAVPCPAGTAVPQDPEAASPTVPATDPAIEPTADLLTDPPVTPDPVASAEILIATAEPTSGAPAATDAAVPSQEEPTPEAVAPTSAPPSPSPSLRPKALAASGQANIGVNPAPAMTLVGHGFTEVSFTIRATADAAWLATYTVGLSNGGTPIPGVGVATLVMRDRPPVVLSPGQQAGIDVGAPIPLYRLVVLGAVSAPTLGEIGPDPLAVEPLAGEVFAAGLSGPPFTSPHGPYTLTTDACAACHASHTAQGPMLLVSPEPLAGMCLSCHDGTGALTDIAAQYSDPAVPANDAVTGSWYSHPATTLSNHTSDRDPGEFAGVLNRHTACTDCHQPHLADATLAGETAAGWTASGALMGAAGVSVQNGAAGAAPIYTLNATSSLEYELCFKCHSGFTQLNPQTGPPSTWALDKAVELNPANLSYHPIEAPGTNQTPKMDANLAGSSPFKLWNFTSDSTIRCVNCHGDSRLANPASPPAAGARLAPHAVANRGMLISPLRDRALKGPSEAYAAADFALCYVCHAEAPFVDTSESSRADTNFRFHGLHVADLRFFWGPAGGTVDDDGAGRGNALCAECHFRTHGTTYAVDGQVPASRLVNFAPNVQPYDGWDPAYAGELLWDAPTRSCTLTCHGVPHRGRSY